MHKLWEYLLVIFSVSRNYQKLRKPVLRIQIHSDLVFMGHPDTGKKTDPNPLSTKKLYVNLIFSLFITVQIQFREKMLVSLNLSVIICLHLIRKCHKKKTFFMTFHKNISKYHPDPQHFIKIIIIPAILIKICISFLFLLNKN